MTSSTATAAADLLTAPVVAYLNCEQVAEMLHCCTVTLRAWVRSGRFPAPRRIGRRWLWPTDIVQQAVEQAVCQEFLP